MELDQADRIMAGKLSVTSLFYLEGPKQTELTEYLENSLQPNSLQRFDLFDLRSYETILKLEHMPTNSDLADSPWKYYLFFDERSIGGPYNTTQIARGLNEAKRIILNKIIPEWDIEQRVREAYQKFVDDRNLRVTERLKTTQRGFSDIETLNKILHAIFSY